MSIHHSGQAVPRRPRARSWQRSEVIIKPVRFWLHAVFLFTLVCGISPTRSAAEIILSSRLTSAATLARASVDGLTDVVDSGDPKNQTDFLPAALSDSAAASGTGTTSSANATGNGELTLDLAADTLEVTASSTSEASASATSAPGFGREADALGFGHGVILTVELTNSSYTYTITGNVTGGGGGVLDPSGTNGEATVFLTSENGSQIVFAIQADGAESKPISTSGILTPGRWTIEASSTSTAVADNEFSAGSSSASVDCVFKLTPVTAAPSQVLNISTRLRVLTDNNVLIGGFIITGTEPKKVLLRGIGPSLAQFFTGFLSDPTLELFQGETLLLSNDNWKESQQGEIEATGLAPSADAESAIVTTLDPGLYTVIVRGSNATTGIGLVEAYDLDSTVVAKLANISTRGFVDSNDNVMIGGFIIGPDGQGDATILIRAIGPSLVGAGIPDALVDPFLELHNGDGMTVEANDNWKDTQQSEIEATTLIPADDLESAMVITLQPGAYTGIVRGVNNGTGVGLVEAYQLD